MAKSIGPKYTHYRFVRGSVAFAGELRAEGDVVAIKDIDVTTLPAGYLPTIDESIAQTGNHWNIMEGGTLDEDGTFIPTEMDDPRKPEAKAPAAKDEDDDDEAAE